MEGDLCQRRRSGRALGSFPGWEAKVRLGGWEMFLGQKYVYKNGKVVKTRLYPLLCQERTYLPLKDFPRQWATASPLQAMIQNTSSGNMRNLPGKIKTEVNKMKIAVSPMLSHIKST